MPNAETGVLILDDIQYQATFCNSRGRPDPGDLGVPWSPEPPTVTAPTILPPYVPSVFPPLTTELPTHPPITVVEITESPTIEISPIPTVMTIPPM